MDNGKPFRNATKAGIALFIIGLIFFTVILYLSLINIINEIVFGTSGFAVEILIALLIVRFGRKK